MKEPLFAIIQALSKSEKRYFKIQVSGKEAKKTKKYLQIFDIIEQQKEYNEQLVKGKLKKNGVNITYFSADKNYLYQLIIKSLRTLYSSTSARVRVHNFLIEVELLIDKGLPNLALKQLKKAKRLAQKHELFSLLLETLRWERKILGISTDRGALLRENIAHAEALDLSIDFFEYDFMYREAMLIRKETSKARSEKAAKTFDAFVKQPKLAPQETPKSFYAKLRFLQIWAAYDYSIDDKKKEFECNEKMLLLIEENDYFKGDHTLDYVTIFSRYLILTKHVMPLVYKDTLLEFKSIPKLAPGKVHVEALVFTISNSTEMTRMIDANEFEEALNLIPEVKLGMKKYEDYVDLPFKMAMHYRFAYVFLAKEQYGEALTQLNNLLDEFQEDTRPDIFRFAKLLTLIVHYELGNDTLLPYFSQSFALHLKKRNLLFKTELIVVKYMKKLAKLNRGESRDSVFLEFKKDLITVLADSYERNFLAYFDILAWVESKIENIPFAQAK